MDSRLSFERLETRRQSILRVKPSSTFMLVANKSDKPPEEREVLKEEGTALAKLFGCYYMETSAKTGRNVEHLFISMIRILRGTQPTDAACSSRIAIEGQKPSKSKKCFIF